MTSSPKIGTLREKPLHASLKRWASLEGDLVEQPVENYVIDLVRGDLLIEIQTRGFSSMRQKLLQLIDGHRVRIVFPVAAEKWILKEDVSGKRQARRRSPVRQSFVDVCGELVSFPELLGNPNLEVEVVLAVVEEVRHFEPDKAWRRKGWVVKERRLVEVLDSVLIQSPNDLAALLPPELPAEFTTADLAAELGRPRRLAQQIAYCLRKLHVITQVGKTGNAAVYTLADA